MTRQPPPYRKIPFSEVKSAWRRLLSAQPYESIPDILSRGKKLSPLSDYYHQEARWACDMHGWRGFTNSWADPRIRGNILSKSGGDEKIARGLLKHRSYLPSHFDPWIASCLYQTFKARRVLDPCAGWGDRLMGAMGGGVGEYVGFDPNTALSSGYLRQIQDFSPISPHIVHPLPFEDAHVEADYFDVVLTSPPYWCLEHYCLEETQSYIRYPTWNKWLTGFFYPLIDKSVWALKSGGHMCLHVSDICINKKHYPLEERLISRCGGLPLEYVGKSLVPLQSRSHITKHEPIHIWRKV